MGAVLVGLKNLFEIMSLLEMDALRLVGLIAMVYFAIKLVRAEMRSEKEKLVRVPVRVLTEEELKELAKLRSVDSTDAL